MKKTIAALVLGLLLSGTVAAKLEVGAVPPDYLGRSPDKQDIRISQYRGSVVVLTFWASWCGPCRRELPVLDALQKTAGGRMHTIAVNVKDSVEDYRIMRRQMKDSALIFTHDKQGSISEGYVVKSYPNLYVIDQNGVIAAVHVGFNDDSLLEILEDVNKLLASPPPPPVASAG